ncbi:MAG: hypothetical protein [Cotesia congregata filamentous virus 2]
MNEISELCIQIKYHFEELIPQKMYLFTEAGMKVEIDKTLSIVKLMRTIHNDYLQYNKHLLAISYDKKNSGDTFNHMFIEESEIKIKTLKNIEELKTSTPLTIAKDIKITIASYSCVPQMLESRLNYSPSDNNERLIQFYCADNFTSLLSFIQWHYNNNDDVITLIGVILKSSITNIELEYLNSALAACTSLLGMTVAYPGQNSKNTYVFSNNNFQSDLNRCIIKFTNVYVQFHVPSMPINTTSGNRDVIFEKNNISIINPTKCNYSKNKLNNQVQSVLYYMSDMTVLSLPKELKDIVKMQKTLTCFLITSQCTDEYKFIPYIITLYHYFLKNPNNKLILILKITPQLHTILGHLQSKINNHSIWTKLVYTNKTYKTDTLIISTSRFKVKTIREEHLLEIVDSITNEIVLIIHKNDINASDILLKHSYVNAYIKDTGLVKIKNLLTSSVSSNLNNESMNIIYQLPNILNKTLYPLYTENKMIIVYDKNDPDVLKQIFSTFINDIEGKEISFVHISDKDDLKNEFRIQLSDDLLNNNITFKNNLNANIATVYNNKQSNIKIIINNPSSSLSSSAAQLGLLSNISLPNTIQIFNSCIINNSLTSLVEPRSDILPINTISSYPNITEDHKIILSILKKRTKSSMSTTKDTSNDDEDGEDDDGADDSKDDEINYDGYELYDSNYEIILSNVSNNQINLDIISKDLICIQIPKIIKKQNANRIIPFDEYQHRINNIGVIPKIVLHFIYNPEITLLENMFNFIKDSKLTENYHHVIMFTSKNPINKNNSIISDYNVRDNIILNSHKVNSFINVNVIASKPIAESILKIEKLEKIGLTIIIKNNEEINSLFGSVGGIWKDTTYKKYNMAFCLHQYVKELLWMEPLHSQSILDFQISNLKTMSWGFFTMNDITYLPLQASIMQNDKMLNADLDYAKIMFVKINIIQLPRLCYCMMKKMTSDDEMSIINLHINDTMFKSSNIDIKKYIHDCFEKYKIIYEYDSYNNIYWLFKGFKLNVLNTDLIKFQSIKNTNYYLSLNNAVHISNYYTRYINSGGRDINQFSYIALTSDKSSIDVTSIYPPFTIESNIHHTKPMNLFEYKMNDNSAEVIPIVQFLNVPLNTSNIYDFSKMVYNYSFNNTYIEKYMGFNIYIYKNVTDDELLTLLYYKMCSYGRNSIFILVNVNLSVNFQIRLTTVASKLPNWLLYNETDKICIMLSGIQHLKAECTVDNVYKISCDELKFNFMSNNIDPQKKKSLSSHSRDSSVTLITLLEPTDTDTDVINYKSGNLYKINPSDATNKIRGLWSYNMNTFVKNTYEQLFSNIQNFDLIHITEDIKGINVIDHSRSNGSGTIRYVFVHIDFKYDFRCLPINTLIDNGIDFGSTAPQTQILFLIYRNYPNVLGDKVVDANFYTNLSEDDFFNHIQLGVNTYHSNARYFTKKVRLTEKFNILAIRPRNDWTSNDLNPIDDKFIKINNLTITTDKEYNNTEGDEIIVKIQSISTLTTSLPQNFKQKNAKLDSPYFNNGHFITISNEP